jgi:hypothetical protein
MSLENLKNKKGFFSLKPSSKNDILKAEKQLGLSFSNDFKKYTSMYGAISVNGKEITGVVESNRLSVVKNTLQARIENENFPDTMYVIEDLAIEMCLILQDKDGEIYRHTPIALEYINENLLDYIES